MRLRYLAQSVLSRLGVAIDLEVDRDRQQVANGLFPLVKTEHELIRIGGRDGGYLVPDDLEGIIACFSPGVDYTADFEAEMIRRGIPTFQADASVADTPLHHPMNDFEKKFIGLTSDDETVTMADWVAAKVGDREGDLLLQMDIEGSEWLALATMDEALLKRFRVMVLELHHLQLMVGRLGSTIIPPVIQRLTRYFDVVHLHANNVSQLARLRHVTFPQLVEVTLLRKDRSHRRTAAAALPHPLDQDNVPGNRPVRMPESFYLPSSRPSA